jgi:outer membrane protein OmpA-like peptidoglycan-associated protein
MVMMPMVGRRTLLPFFPAILLGLGLQGCVATRGWVIEQTTPLAGRVSNVETRLSQTEAKADRALDRLDHLRLERRFVLDLKHGANFAFNSAALTDEASRAIDGFLSDLRETEDTIFLVAGHTDSIGPEDYNYQLGQKRAASVAGYLIAHKGIDPLRVTTVSYGESVPLADNATLEGRHKNRRIEILVYKEAITSSPRETTPHAKAHGPEESRTLASRK